MKVALESDQPQSDLYVTPIGGTLDQLPVPQEEIPSSQAELPIANPEDNLDLEFRSADSF